MGRVDTASHPRIRWSGMQPVRWTVRQGRVAAAVDRPDPVNLIIFLILVLTVLILVATVSFAVSGP